MSLDIATFEDEESGSVSSIRDIGLLKKLWPYVRPHRKLLVGSLLLLIPVTLSQIALPVIVRRAIDGPMAAGDFNGLWLLCGGYFLIMAVHYILKYHVMVMSQVAGQRIVYDLRTGFYRHLQSLSPRFYHRTPIGRLVTRITNDVENLSEMFSSGGLSILMDLAIILGAVIAMFWLHWQMALATFGMILVISAVMEVLRRRSRDAYNTIRVKVAALNAFLQENFSGMDVVQLYRREEKNYRDFEELNQDNLKINLNSVLYDCSLTSSVEFLTIVATILILWIGGVAIGAGGMTFGVLVAFFLYAQMIFDPLEDLAEKYTIIQAGLASIDKIMGFFTLQPEIPAGETVSSVSTRSVSTRLDGHIRFEDVTFGYLEHTPVVRGISFDLPPGRSAAIIGPTGAGKTTLIKLLTRFYDVNGGRILIDGKDIRELPVAELRRNIVVIQQDDFLFSRSVAENITLDPEKAGDPEEEPRLREVLSQVQALDLVSRLEGGIHHVLRERGRNLSGGERQLLLFARAIYHDPAILVLDEATSAIDPHTETRVQHAMERLMAERTTLLIAHRLSTIEQADQILVISQGQLAESGSHTELVRQDGLYARFYRYHEILEHPAGGVKSDVK